jgi:menaquinone-9 beta-reductase
MAPDHHAEVAVVGGGPAGAAVAVNLARRGIDAVLFERRSAFAWRACGVYSSPLSALRLRRLGVPPSRLAELSVGVAGLVVESAETGDRARLGYEHRDGARGFDRPALDEELLRLAMSAGARVRRGTVVRSIEPAAHPGSARGSLSAFGPDGAERWTFRLVVGADGPGSMVARAFGVQRRTGWRRAGITFHVPQQDGAHDRADTPDARMVIGRGWYCGICPVPGRRLNIGIVLSEVDLRARLRRGQLPEDIGRDILRLVPRGGGALATGPILDNVAVHLPLANRVRRLAGPGFVLVGDAAGFLDPISGEGLHRSLVSAAAASDAIACCLTGERSASLDGYDRRLRRRFGRKDAVSWILQAFLARPEALAYAVRRLEGRPQLRQSFAAVMADLAPAERVLDPRFLAALLRP